MLPPRRRQVPICACYPTSSTAFSFLPSFLFHHPKQHGDRRLTSFFDFFDSFAQTDHAQCALPALSDGQSSSSHRRGPVSGILVRLLQQGLWRRHEEGANVGSDGVEGGRRRPSHVATVRHAWSDRSGAERCSPKVSFDGTGASEWKLR